MIDTKDKPALAKVVIDDPDLLGFLINKLTPFDSMVVTKMNVVAYYINDVYAGAACEGIEDFVISEAVDDPDEEVWVEKDERLNPIYSLHSTATDIEEAFEEIPGSDMLAIRGVSDPENQYVDDTFTLFGRTISFRSLTLDVKFRSKVQYTPFQLPDLGELLYACEYQTQSTPIH